MMDKAREVRVRPNGRMEALGNCCPLEGDTRRTDVVQSLFEHGFRIGTFKLSLLEHEHSFHDVS